MLQVLTYRDRLLTEMTSVYEGGSLLRRSAPDCAVIVGNTSTLDSDDKRRSFELMRSRSDVIILTFDELRDRLRGIRTALEAVEPANSSDASDQT